MNTLTEEKVTTDITVQQIAFYLKKQGWHQVEHPSESFEVFTAPIKDDLGEPLTIAIPNKDDYEDTPIRISDILNFLEKFEGRSIFDIVAAIRQKSEGNTAEIQDEKKILLKKWPKKYIKNLVDPISNNLQDETGWLREKNWTFRHFNKKFEYLESIESSLEENYRQNYREFYEYEKEMASLFDKHDHLLQLLQNECKSLFDSLCADQKFKKEVNQCLKCLIEENPSRKNVFSEEKLLTLVAERVTNNIKEIPGHYEDAAFWKKFGKELSQWAKSSLKEKIEKVGSEFLELNEKIIKKLLYIRREINSPGPGKKTSRAIDLSEVDEFSKVQKFLNYNIDEKILAKVQSLHEVNDLEPFVRKILNDPNDTPHGPTEIADILTHHVHMNGKKQFTAFVLKGRSYSKVSSKNVAHQFAKLRQIPELDLMVFGTVGEIHDDAKRDFAQTAFDHKCNYMIIDKFDWARLLLAYGKISK